MSAVVFGCSDQRWHRFPPQLTNKQCAPRLFWYPPRESLTTQQANSLKGAAVLYRCGRLAPAVVNQSTQRDRSVRSFSKRGHPFGLLSFCWKAPPSTGPRGSGPRVISQPITRSPVTPRRLSVRSLGAGISCVANIAIQPNRRPKLRSRATAITGCAPRRHRHWAHSLMSPYRAGPGRNADRPLRT
jgi:hypothetical protein